MRNTDATECSCALIRRRLGRTIIPWLAGVRTLAAHRRFLRALNVALLFGFAFCTAKPTVAQEFFPSLDRDLPVIEPADNFDPEVSRQSSNGGQAARQTSALLRQRRIAAADHSSSEPVWPRTFPFGRSSTFRLRGRVDTDFIWTSQSALNQQTYGDLGDSVGLRRARIGAEGHLGTDGRYVTEIDLAPGIVVPRDVYVARGDLNSFGERRAGHFREPFSLEGGTSANTFAFMERSPVNLLDPARNWGLGLYRAEMDDSSTFNFGVFHAGTDAGDFQGGDGSTVGFTGRLTAAPIYADNGRRLLHFGLALSERVPESGVIVISQQPQSPLLDLGDSSTSPFVPTIRIPARFQQLINGQIAVAKGSFWSQAEWYGTFIDQIGGGTVFFRGSYVACGYFLTGENREYLAKNGILGPVHVARPLLRCPGSESRERGWGSWELTARFAYLDFFDPDTPLGPSGQLLGSFEPDTTFGVNWYLADHVRLMFNYSYVQPTELNTGSSAANVFGMRLGIFW